MWVSVLLCSSYGHYRRILLFYHFYQSRPRFKLYLFQFLWREMWWPGWGGCEWCGFRFLKQQQQQKRAGGHCLVSFFPFPNTPSFRLFTQNASVTTTWRSVLGDESRLGHLSKRVPEVHHKHMMNFGSTTQESIFLELNVVLCRGCKF